MTAPVDDAAVERSLDALDTAASLILMIDGADTYVPTSARAIGLAHGIGDALTSDDARTAWFLMLGLCPYHRVPLDRCSPDDEDPVCAMFRRGVPCPIECEWCGEPENDEQGPVTMLRHAGCRGRRFGDTPGGGS